MITGFTSHKLDVVSTYNKNIPFQVGVNGVTKIDYNPTNPTEIVKVYYTIGNINYETNYEEPQYPTIFKTTMSGYDFDDYFSIKEEAKMGLVFPPKVTNELFIERMSVAVFERHSRLSEIKTLEGLIEYRNGYYNIIENR